MRVHILYARNIQFVISEIHDTIADHNTNDVNIKSSISIQNSNKQIWNVFASITLASDKELILHPFRSFAFEEVFNRSIVIVCCSVIGMLVIGISVD